MHKPISHFNFVRFLSFLHVFVLRFYSHNGLKNVLYLSPTVFPFVLMLSEVIA